MRDKPRSLARARADKRWCRRGWPRSRDRRCRDRFHRGRGRARDPAALASRAGRRKRRGAPAARRRASPRRDGKAESRAATSASHMGAPRGLRWRGRDSDPWGVISKNAALRASREPQERVDFETPQSLLWRGRAGEGATRLGRHRSAMMTSAFPAAAPRRRWLLFLPFALVVLLAAAWTGVWFYAAARAEAEIAVWRERERQAGRAQDCASHSIGGFSFRIEVRFGGGAFSAQGTPPPPPHPPPPLVAPPVPDPQLLLAGGFRPPPNSPTSGPPPPPRHSS